jgi:hypothetical protein
MPREKSIARREDRIAASSSSSDADDHKSVGTDQEQVPEAQASSYDASSSNVMVQSQGGSYIVGLMHPYYSIVSPTFN